MDTLPATVSSWRTAVGVANVGNLPLSAMSDDTNRFSGSKIPRSAFLQLRALWKPSSSAFSLLKSLSKSGLIDNNDESWARKLIKKRQDTYGSFEYFLDQVSRVSRDTSQDEERYRMEMLKFFVAPSECWSVLLPKQHSGASEDYTPKVRPAGVDEALQKMPPVSRLDLRRPSRAYRGGAHAAVESDVSELTRMFANCEADINACFDDSPSKQRADRLARAVRQDDLPVKMMCLGLDQTPNSESTPSGDPGSSYVPSEPASSGDEDFSLPRPTIGLTRTTYEVQTSNFFAAFLLTIHAYYLYPAYKKCISIETEERGYKFCAAFKKRQNEKLSQEAKVSGSEPSDKRRRDCMFKACPDGAFYRKRNGKKEPFIFFELKPFRREGKLGAKTCLEETAEVAAIISDQLDDNLEKKGGHRVVLSLDRDQFWFVLAEFSKEYVDYLSDPSQTAVPSSFSRGPTDDLKTEHFLRFQPYGPFDMADREAMQEFSVAIIAMAWGQLGKCPDGNLLLKPLKTELES